MRQATIGIVSIGDMGLGMARLLKAHDYRVVTVAEGRSEHTLARIQSAGIETLPSDQELVIQADYVLSIVPPRNAVATAQRIAEAYALPSTGSLRAAIEDIDGRAHRSKLYFLELNAVSARLVSEMAAQFDEPTTPTDHARRCHILDGGIIGAPPSQSTQDGSWKKPSVVLSGSVDLPPAFAKLADVLNMKLVSPRIGAASTLKLSFAALTKGLTALSILSFSTAQKESMLPELLSLLEEYSPRTAALATNGIIGMSPKAYRWEGEMREIGEAFDTEGEWNGVGADVYGGLAEIYRTVAEDTILGEERVGNRIRGRTVDDAAQIIAQRAKARWHHGV
ncbi:Dehydrogenase multihelical [Penicillium paradoxum]|uniref:Dehydrogenase multihelical n=1 Tax=Penicillium paradoxum TaxID=176176 RepID=UPI0025482E57|nr:Dehydrogenase multihelical [Penicillium paradoxum]KAJ5774235.1 Dehydrogenase multihelical [Penicillium paradoxum]